MPLNVMAIIIKQMLLCTLAMDFLIHLPTATHFDCPLCWRTMDCFPSAHLYVCIVHREFWDSCRSWDSLWNLWDMHLFEARLYMLWGIFCNMYFAFAIMYLACLHCVGNTFALYCAARLLQLSFASRLKVQVTHQRLHTGDKCLFSPMSHKCYISAIPVY